MLSLVTDEGPAGGLREGIAGIIKIVVLPSVSLKAVLAEPVWTREAQPRGKNTVYKPAGFKKYMGEYIRISHFSIHGKGGAK